MKKKSTSNYILTSTEKKQNKQNKIHRMLVLLIVISLAFNIVYLLDVKVPFINSDGEFTGFELPEIKHHPSIIKRFFKDNTSFEGFTSLELETRNGTYDIVKYNNMCSLFSIEGFDIEYCDFELAKWEELERIVLKYQLRRYDVNRHVDKEGRIQNYNVAYEFSVKVNGNNMKLEIPENVEEIEDYLKELTELARTK